MTAITIRPPLVPPKATVVLPASKSISNRLLVIRHIAGSNAPIHNLSQADDTVLLEAILSELLSKSRAGLNEPNVVYSANAGTVYRFLTALLATQSGRWFLTGSERMLQRPVAPLVDALNTLGANISYAGSMHFPPLVIDGAKLSGGQVEMDASMSSQFVSALMMIAPIMNNGLTIRRCGRLTSEPYITMTARLMQNFGVNITIERNEIVVGKGDYCFKETFVEFDWSSAAFWYEIAMLIPQSEFLLKSLDNSVLQGDAVLCDFFKTLGVITTPTSQGLFIRRVSEPPASFEADCSGCPDIVPALAVSCAASGVKAILKGVETLRYKESDRIEGLLAGLKQINSNVFFNSKGELVIPECPQQTGVSVLNFHSHGDHRMAMAFAPLAAVAGMARIEEPDVVSKSYPAFWNCLKQSGFEIS